VRGRVIDVSPAAAQVLGFSGLTQVAVDVAQ
jgi:rare lipoprotein A (peptidoglycan hydrolase)